MRCAADLHDEGRARSHVGLFGLQQAVAVVQVVPARAHHVHHVGVHHREVREAPRGHAQHAHVVVERGRAVFQLDALLLVIHDEAAWFKVTLREAVLLS